jgi:itaconyl-CoA hydratase
MIMVGIAKEVGPSRWRESFGRYYEELPVVAWTP